MSEPRPLGSTYRLQLAGLGFEGARSLIGYLHELGIETLYLSPILEAVPGSSHGYDVVNPTRLDPALGTLGEFDALLAELEAHDMRALLDIVPNHMACHRSNAWWWDVLRLGRASPFAPTFDIDWSRHGGRVLVPTLPAPVSDLMDSFAFHGEDPNQELELGGQSFPLGPGSRVDGDHRAVLERQHYRPAFWRMSNREGNYRRFFDIDGLIGVRVEEGEVFQRTHRFIAALANDERVAGWRIDHVDGLSDPRAYLERLGALPLGARATPPVALVEKILARDEVLRPAWRVDGSTGYEFADAVGGLFVSEPGAREIAACGAEVAGTVVTFAELSREAKREALVGAFDGALGRLVRLTLQSLDDRHPGHDLTVFALRCAVVELTVSLDVYRTYVAHSPVDAEDLARLRRAARTATLTLSGESRRALELLMVVLEEPSESSLELVQRWQQLCAAVMAKGAEDTATYRYAGLLSHADVGGDPDRASCEPATFHRFLTARQSYPLTLNATSTHDSKRGEDSRARLFTLSECPDEWLGLERRWRRRYRTFSAHLDPVDELRAYQSFLCLWPLEAARLPRTVVRRLQDYAVKAAREAKRHTNWTDPASSYERSLRRFVGHLAGDDRFALEMRRLLKRISPAAITNSLATVALKCVTPGVPDFYQGTEDFAYTLTDPDNRQSVDFVTLRKTLERLRERDEGAGRAHALGAQLERGDAHALKLHVTRRLLHLRRERRELFAYGSYRALTLSGSHENNAIAVARSHDRQWIVACVARQSLAVAGPGRYATGRRWVDTALHLPSNAPTDFVDVLSGARVRARRGTIELAECLDELPVSVLVSRSPRER